MKSEIIKSLSTLQIVKTVYNSNIKWLKPIKWFTLIVILLLQIACQEVIEIDLNSAQPRLVIEALLQADSVLVVELSTTTDYFDTDTIIHVTDAHVLLADNEGNQESIPLVNDGVYRGANLRGQAGQSYTLSVDYKGKTYSGNCKLNTPVKIFSVNPKQIETPVGGHGTRYVLELNFASLPENGNYFLIRYYAIGDLIGFNAIDGSRFLHNDTITFTSAQRRYEQGELAKVEIAAIDYTLYEYYRQLSEVAQSNMRNSSAPYNPTSNLNNGALGAFAAWSMRSSEVLIE